MFLEPFQQAAAFSYSSNVGWCGAEVVFELRLGQALVSKDAQEGTVGMTMRIYV